MLRLVLPYLWTADPDRHSFDRLFVVLHAPVLVGDLEGIGGQHLPQDFSKGLQSILQDSESKHGRKLQCQTTRALTEKSVQDNQLHFWSSVRKQK